MLEIIKEILKDYTDLPSEQITEETSLASDLEINSYELVNIIMIFEERFGIEIPDRDIAELTTIKDIITYINNKKQAESDK